MFEEYTPAVGCLTGMSDSTPSQHDTPLASSAPAPHDVPRWRRSGGYRVLLVAVILLTSGYAAWRFSDRDWLGHPDVVMPRSIRETYPKFRHDGERSFLWAEGPRDPTAVDSHWFDMTDSPIPVEDVNHGIGKDTIPAIDEPVFVKPDDERLLRSWGNASFDQVLSLSVLGYAHNGDARAYPIRLMNRHELVNDVIGGKPVTVGW